MYKKKNAITCYTLITHIRCIILSQYDEYTRGFRFYKILNT